MQEDFPPPWQRLDRLSGGASWNDDGVIVFSSNGLKRVSSAGGSIIPLATGDDLASVLYPRFLPDGQRLFFRANRPIETETGIFVGALNGKPVQISRDYSNAEYLSAAGDRDLGWILFRRADALMAQRFDARTLRVEEDALIVGEGIAGGIGQGEFSVSHKGDLAYRSATLFQLRWVDRAGATLEAVGPPSTDWSPANEFTRLSPDETKLAYSRLHAEEGGRNREVWQLDLVRSVPERVTFAPSPDLAPVWSPDSSQLAFTSNRNSSTGFDTYLMSEVST